MPSQPAEGQPVPATRSGWVRHLDTDALLQRLDGPVTVWLQVRPGMFVTEGENLAVLSHGRNGGDSDHTDSVQAAVMLEDSRANGQDVMFGIRELVDVALGALSKGTNDSTSAFETIKYLGAVVREVLLRDLPPATTSDGGVTVVRGYELAAEEYVHRAFGPIHRDGGDQPEVVIALIDTLGMLVRHLSALGGWPRRTVAGSA